MDRFIRALTSQLYVHELGIESAGRIIGAVAVTMSDPIQVIDREVGICKSLYAVFESLGAECEKS